MRQAGWGVRPTRSFSPPSMNHSFDLKPPRVPPSPPAGIKVAASYGRLVVSGPGASMVRQLPGATHNKKQNVWELSLTMPTLRAVRELTRRTPEQFAGFCTDEVLSWARAASQVNRASAELHRRINDGWRLDLPWIDNGSEADRPPYDHQRVMATVACNLDGSALLCEMGTGKTRAAIASIAYRFEQRHIDIAVVICPKGVMGTWEREVALWSNDLRTITLMGNVEARKSRVNAMSGLRVATPLVVIVNYDVVHAMAKEFQELCSRLKVGLIMDEIHKIRNPNTQVGKATHKIATKAAWRLGMSGSPILQGAHDIWSQWYALDWGVTFGGNFVQFRREFFSESEYDYSIDPLDGTLDEVGQRMRLIGVRYRKADCMDLPPKTYTTVEVDLTTEQKKAYNEMAEQLVAWIEGRGELPGGGEKIEGKEATAANQLVASLRLSTITSGFIKTEDGELHRFSPNPKLAALETLVEENIGMQQIIVWARYREDIKAIARKLAAFNPVIIQGGMTLPDRETAELLFQQGTSRLFIGNQAAAGVGLNLQAGSLAIYYSQGFSLEQRIQSEDRCHRSGSEVHSSITYVNLMAKNTIDDLVIWPALEGKKTTADIVVDLHRALGIA